MQLTEALSPGINACPPPFLPPGKGKWDTRQVGQGNPERVQKNSPSLSNSIRGHGPREVMSQLYKPPVLLAFCSGRATARGAPTSNLLTKQRICRFELNTHVTFQSVRTRRYWGYSLSRSPLILCQFRWWGRTKAEPCDTHTHTHKTMQVKHKKKGCWNKVKDTRVSHRISSSLWSTILVFQKLRFAQSLPPAPMPRTL